MKVAIGADHAGFMLKESVRKILEKKNIKVVDVGTKDKKSVDYPDFAKKVGKLVQDRKVDTGIMVCGTGMGVTVSLNKMNGIIAANCFNKKVTAQARKHLNANVMALGGDVVSEKRVEGIVDAWLGSEFEGGRHARRMDKVFDLEASERGKAVKKSPEKK